MDVKNISESLSVSAQITLEDVRLLAKQGFRSSICNRPDGEGADQPTFDEIAAETAKYRMEAHYLPVVAGKVSDTESRAFKKAMENLPKPARAYCRSGMRSAI